MFTIICLSLDRIRPLSALIAQHRVSEADIFDRHKCRKLFPSPWSIGPASPNQDNRVVRQFFIQCRIRRWWGGSLTNPPWAPLSMLLTYIFEDDFGITFLGHIKASHFQPFSRYLPSLFLLISEISFLSTYGTSFFLQWSSKAWPPTHSFMNFFLSFHLFSSYNAKQLLPFSHSVSELRGFFPMKQDKV